jgi:hypothetical protein
MNLKKNNEKKSKNNINQQRLTCQIHDLDNISNLQSGL